MNNKISIKETAKLLEIAPQTLRVFIQNGKFNEFATCCKPNLKYYYYINKKQLFCYIQDS